MPGVSPIGSSLAGAWGSSEHALSALGKNCADLAMNLIERTDSKDLQSRAIGRIRTKVRDQLASELESIDILVEVLSSGKSKAAVEAEVRKRRRRRSTNETGNLFH
jgi:hypothetical protein